MKVDGKLLEKYYKGHCTKIEKEVVEKWLTSDIFDDAPLQLSKAENKVAHKQKMWQQISEVFKKPTVKIVPLYQKISGYAAACIVLFFVGYSSISIFDNTSNNSTVAINGNCIKETKQIPIAGRNFTLIQNDCIEDIISDWKKTKSEVVFSGKVEIMHNHKRAIGYRVLNSENASVNYKEGIRYFAFKVKDNNGFEKTHLVDEAGFKAYFPRLQFFLS
ncbi:hypothetical protein GCM10022397_11130 [Flavivirga jejuensis]